MADYPIIFSAPMVRGLLREAEVPGTGKTNTRRLAWSKEEDRVLSTEELCQLERKGWQAIDGAGEITTIAKPSPWQKVQPGDRLWVKETWENSIGAPDEVSYRATVDRDAAEGWTPEEIAEIRWKPSIYMPRWASRLTLIVTGTKIEPLQDLSENDAIAEGVEPLHHGFFPYGITTFLTAMIGGKEVPAQCCLNARDSFRLLWESLYGRSAWDANPEVVALSFRVIRANIDSVEALAA